MHKRLAQLLVLVAGSLIFSTYWGTESEALQSCNALPFTDESEHHLYGRPVLRINPANAPQTIDLIIRQNYEIRNNGDNKFADWVAYYIDGSSFGTASSSVNYGNDLCIAPNRTLEADPADMDDFLNAQSLGLVRTHLASNLTFAGAPNASDLDLYSNIVPMHEAMVDTWIEFEQLIRDYVLREGPVYVIAGPEYRKEMPSLPEADEDHTIPSGYWKFVYEDQGNELHQLNWKYKGVFFDQSGCFSSDAEVAQTCREKISDWRNNPIRWVDVQGFTRLDFNTELENGLEQDVELFGGILELE